MEQPDPKPAYPPGSLRVGSIGGVAVLLSPSWVLITVVLAYLLAPQIDDVQPGLGAWKYVAGLAYAILLYLTVLLHEVSHALVANRFGLPVRWISLNFLGGMTTIDAEPRTPGEQFKIAVVGPLTSLAVGAVALGIGHLLPPGLVGAAVEGVAVANLLIGGLNLVPGLPLDGGRVLQSAVWRFSGSRHRGTEVAAWGGRIVALLVLAWLVAGSLLTGSAPSVSNILIGWVVAAFIWSGASAALASARIRERLPALRARTLARRAIAVPGELSVAEAVRRAQDEGAGGIVVHSGDERVSGLVSQAALNAIPVERRPWQPVSSVTRSLEDGMIISADLDGEDLVRALGGAPLGEYLLVETDGTIYGVLSVEDVDHAFRASQSGPRPTPADGDHR